MNKPDVLARADLEQIVQRFYANMLADPIIGFIFTDVAKIQLEQHLPIIVNFWHDVLFKGKLYRGNALQKHLQLNQLINLKPGHFTRWLFLFHAAVDEQHAGDNAEKMKQRATLVADAISSAIGERKKGQVPLVLPQD